MRLLSTDNDKFIFQIEASEKRLLLQLLNLYPLIPADYHELSRTGDCEKDQKLLEEALAAHRAENRQELQAMLQEKSRFEPHGTGFRFSLDLPQLEWLLQVLNDVRVGSWLALGSPADSVEMARALNEKSKRYYWTMETAGQFQMVLLQVRDGQPPEAPAAPSS